MNDHVRWVLSNWPVFWALSVALAAGLSSPIARGFVAGRGSAANPAHRVIPSSPWRFFFREFMGAGRALILWMMFFFLLGPLNVLSTYDFGRHVIQRNQFSWIMDFHLALIPIEMGVCFILMATWLAFETAHRIRNEHALYFTMVILCSLLTPLLIWAINACLPEALSRINYRGMTPNGDPTFSAVTLVPLWVIAIVFTFNVSTILKISRRPDSWFKFEE